MKGKTVKRICKVLALGIAVGALAAGNTMSAQAAPKQMPGGWIFDAEYYGQTYADVAAVYGLEESDLYRHYLEFGISENREGVAVPDKSVFDAEAYAAAYPDVVAAFGNGRNNLYQHYLIFGQKEGRTEGVSEAAAIPVAGESTAPVAEDAVVPSAGESTAPVAEDATVPSTEETAVPSAEESADQSQIAAAYNEQGDMCYDADDYAGAMEWYTKAAALGNTDAMINIGSLYHYAQGVDQDYAKAMEWFEKAANLGNSNAINIIARLYYHGTGVEQDRAKARELYKKAAEMGNADAQDWLRFNP